MSKMSSLRKKLDTILRQGAREAQVELYHWELSGAGPRARLLVYIDTPTGVTLKDCERTSRAIEALLEAQDPIATPYVLEVSSPGIERRLWERWHFERAVGKKVKLFLKPARGRKNVLVGKLAEVTQDKVIVDHQGQRLEVDFSEITRAQVVYEPGTEGK